PTGNPRMYPFPTLNALPLSNRPGVLVPTMVARLFSSAKAATISPALAVCSLTNNTTRPWKPVVQVNLVQIGSYDLLSQFMRFRAHEWHVPAGQHCDQRLHDAVGIRVGERVRRFHRAQRSRDHQ